ncbi:MAG: glycosyltransferase [Oscillospiraceae bacterium]
MRIALFTETYVPHINGVVTHVKLLKEGLEKLGHTVMIVTADANTRHHYVENNILHCPATKLKKFYSYSVAPPISRTRLKMIENFNPDIIHIHNEFGIGLSGFRAAKILRVPLVYTLHTMYDEYLYYVVPSKFVNAVKRISHKYFKLLGEKAQAITGPSKKCEEYFNLVGVHKTVHVIPNAVELDSFMPENISDDSKKAFREKYNIPDDKMIACFVGRLGREKSVDVLLDYWSKSISDSDNIHLVIIGDGPVKNELEQQAKNLKIDNMITFTGAIEHTDLPPYLASCDIYITASLSDTNSISMLEGMATGLPVLQRLDELNEDQVINGKNGFVFNMPKEMAQELRNFKNMSNEEKIKLSKSVTESVRESGAVDLARHLLEVYAEII